MQRKGIILAGGTGSRLWPLTIGVSKQLMPVYDKPLIYYPLSVLMLAGIREILIITTREDQPAFQRLLGDGSQWGLAFSYVVQPAPKGLAEAFILGEPFLAGAPSAMVLGDNIFFGHGLPELLKAADRQTDRATVFAYHVNEAERYGVVEFDSAGQAISIVEKPRQPKSNYAVTGLYFYDARAPELAKTLAPSARGELEITDLNQLYLEEGNLTVQVMGRGFAWLDTGTHSAMLEGAEFVRTVQVRQGLQVACPEEIAFNLGLIDRAALLAAAERFSKSDYGTYLSSLANGV